MFRCLALGLAPLICDVSAHAQAVELMTFAVASPANPDAPEVLAPALTQRISVDAALRTFLSAQTGRLPSLNHADIAPSICPSAPYAPAPWLSSEVERRRHLHYDAIRQAACDTGVSPSLLDAVVAQESGYRTLAVSRAGAKGLTQLMPGTAKQLGVARPFEPLANLRGGARYLRKQLDRFGRIDLALAAYNAGPERSSLREGRVPAIAETQGYVRSVLSNWERFIHHTSDPLMVEQQIRKEGDNQNGRTVLLATF